MPLTLPYQLVRGIALGAVVLFIAVALVLYVWTSLLVASVASALLMLAVASIVVGVAHLERDRAAPRPSAADPTGYRIKWTRCSSCLRQLRVEFSLVDGKPQPAEVACEACGARHRCSLGWSEELPVIVERWWRTRP